METFSEAFQYHYHPERANQRKNLANYLMKLNQSCEKYSTNKKATSPKEMALLFLQHMRNLPPVGNLKWDNLNVHSCLINQWLNYGYNVHMRILASGDKHIWAEFYYKNVRFSITINEEHNEVTCCNTVTGQQSLVPMMQNFQYLVNPNNTVTVDARCSRIANSFITFCHEVFYRNLLFNVDFPVQ